MEGGGGTGDREKRGDGGGKWDSPGGEVREKRENYATVRNQKKRKEVGANKYRAGKGLNFPPPPPPLPPKKEIQSFYSGGMVV